MTPADLKAARERLGLTQDGLAEALRLPSGGRHIRRLESGQHPISGPISVAVQLLVDVRHGIDPDATEPK
jgi:transcriptional regulator with XRE-family HTH domain